MLIIKMSSFLGMVVRKKFVKLCSLDHIDRGFHYCETLTKSQSEKEILKSLHSANSGKLSSN